MLAARWPRDGEVSPALTPAATGGLPRPLLRERGAEEAGQGCGGGERAIAAEAGRGHLEECGGRCPRADGLSRRPP